MLRLQMPVQVTPDREPALTTSKRTSERLLARVRAHMHEIIRRPIKSLRANFTATRVLSVAVGQAAAHRPGARGVLPKVQKM
jgi:hypothetical protein